MKDFYSFDELSIPLWIKALFWGLYMVIFVYTVWKTILAKHKDKQNMEVSKLFVLYFALYAVFYCVNPDYFSYRNWMSGLDITIWEKEKFYVYLVMICNLLPFDYPFEVFRLIIWGGALLLVWLTSKLYRTLLMPGLTVLFLFVFFSGIFCYARASLGMAVYFLGIVIYLRANNLWVKILGIGLALCSFLFHHEMIIGVAVLPSIIFPFEKKKTIYLSFILLIIAIAGITYINSNLELLEETLGSDDLVDKMEEFNNQEQGVFRISTLVKYLNIFYPFFIISNCFYKHKSQPKTIVGIYRITFVILLITIAFFVVSGSRSTYTYRVMYIAIIPISIMIAYCYKQGYFKQYQFAVMLFLAFLTNSIRLINSI